MSEADKIQRQLLDTLLKHTAVSKVLSEKIEASMGSIPKPLNKKDKDDLYILPQNNELDHTLSSSDEESYTEGSTTESSPNKSWDLHTIDMDSVNFKSLPVDVRHEILTDLKETRKQSSWGLVSIFLLRLRLTETVGREVARASQSERRFFGLSNETIAQKASCADRFRRG